MRRAPELTIPPSPLPPFSPPPLSSFSPPSLPPFPQGSSGSAANLRHSFVVHARRVEEQMSMARQALKELTTTVREMCVSGVVKDPGQIAEEEEKVCVIVFIIFDIY